jgi:hypothetical protein
MFWIQKGCRLAKSQGRIHLSERFQLPCTLIKNGLQLAKGR